MEKFDQVFFDNTLLPPGHYLQQFINIFFNILYCPPRSVSHVLLQLPFWNTPLEYSEYLD